MAIIINVGAPMDKGYQTLILIIQMFMSALLVLSVFKVTSYHFPNPLQIVSIGDVILVGIFYIIHKRSKKAL